MMLTEGLVSGSLVFVMVGYVIALAFQLYMLYLNYKQSQVNNQMIELVNEVKLIRKELQATTKKPKK